jgi:tRNA threonylcarbamoyladenosine biosynthesis protein TsaE
MLMEKFLTDEKDTLNFGKHVALQVEPPFTIYLQGDLGAGKTTWVRGFLSGFDYLGTVKSPTFTLVEEYSLGSIMINHFDLYRLTDPAELQHIGIEEYFKASAIVLIEWPEQGKGFLPDPDLILSFKVADRGRIVMLNKDV